MKSTTKKILISAALIIIAVCFFGVTAAALNAGGFYAFCGIVNGVAELAAIIYTFITFQDKEII